MLTRNYADVVFTFFAFSSLLTTTSSNSRFFVVKSRTIASASANRTAVVFSSAFVAFASRTGSFWQVSAYAVTSLRVNSLFQNNTTVMYRIRSFNIICADMRHVLQYSKSISPVRISVTWAILNCQLVVLHTLIKLSWSDTKFFDGVLFRQCLSSSVVNAVSTTCGTRKLASSPPHGL